MSYLVGFYRSTRQGLNPSLWLSYGTSKAGLKEYIIGKSRPIKRDAVIVHSMNAYSQLIIITNESQSQVDANETQLRMKKVSFLF